MSAPRRQVLIVGGGPVGLAVALELAYQGVHSTLIERDPGTGTELLAKAGTLSARSMEFCRRWGIAPEVSSWGVNDDYPRDTCYVTALNGGHLIGRDTVAPARKRREPRSPEMLRKCPQHVFDPLLARTVAKAGFTDFRYGTECRAIRPDGGGERVTVDMVDVASGRTEHLRADYVVACDGAASAIRTQLGIPFEGVTLDYSVSAMLRIPDLHSYHPIGPATRYVVMGTEGAWANLTSVDYANLWRLTLLGSQERIAPGRVDLHAAIRKILGRDDVPYELMRALPWRRSQCTAARFRSGRVFLAGDAAHTTSPTGGHGLNTGLGDAVGLGWMLAAAVNGWAGPGLLDAYEVERRPVAARNGLASTRNYSAWQGEGMDLDHVLDDGPVGDSARATVGRIMGDRLKAEWHSDGIRMGYRYEGSPVIAPDGSPEPPDDPVGYEQTARPGHRAPHAWIEPGRSTLDLFGRGFVLLRLGSEPPDGSAILNAARTRDVPLSVHTITDPEIAKLYENALVLVRPDGHVAWRAEDVPNATAALSIIDRVRGAG